MPWQDEARCREADLSGSDGDFFYPERDHETYQQQSSRAKAFCLGENRNDWCPVVTECLVFALTFPDTHGIWGGLSNRERRALWRKKNKNLPAWITQEHLDEIGAPQDVGDEQVPGYEEEADLFGWTFGTVVDISLYTVRSTDGRSPSLRDYQVHLVYQGELVSA